MKNEKITLAIETSLSNGSLSVLIGEREIASYVNAENPIRSDNLLALIGNLFHNNGLNLSDLDSIVISTGPGSSTGIRVGIATAQALAAGLKCSLKGVCVLDALKFGLNFNKRKIVALPAGKKRLLWEFTDNSESEDEKQSPGQIRSGSLLNFEDEIRRLDLESEGLLLIAESSLKDHFSNLTSNLKNTTFIVASDNVAKLAALFNNCKK